jgi:hypothetical protein
VNETFPLTGLAAELRAGAAVVGVVAFDPLVAVPILAVVTVVAVAAAAFAGLVAFLAAAAEPVMAAPAPSVPTPVSMTSAPATLCFRFIPPPNWVENRMAPPLNQVTCATRPSSSTAFQGSVKAAVGIGKDG